MILSKQLRIMLLAATLSGVLLVFVKVFVATTLDQPKSEKRRREALAQGIEGIVVSPVRRD